MQVTSSPFKNFRETESLDVRTHRIFSMSWSSGSEVFRNSTW